jgi:hypothetical protein
MCCWELRHMSLILDVWYFTSKLLKICVFCCVIPCHWAWCVLLCDTMSLSMVCSVVWHRVIQHGVFCCVTLCHSARYVLLCDTVSFSMVCSVVWHRVIQCVVANISKDWSVFIFRVMHSTKNVWFLVFFTLMKAHLKGLDIAILDTFQKLHPWGWFVIVGLGHKLINIMCGTDGNKIVFLIHNFVCMLWQFTEGHSACL